MEISKDIRYIGVNDHKIDLFESQYVVENGMAYNSYVILDKKIAVMDTVDARFGKTWLNNMLAVLGERKPDYLVVQHMEPDHSANIVTFAEKYPDAKIVASAKAFMMMQQFFGTDFSERQVVVADGDTLSLGAHELTFVCAPMVHWPEVLMTYDSTDKVLFSADAFGKFGALDAEEAWDDEARRYYFGIVGKYGTQVQKVLKKAALLDIATICPLHGPILNQNLGHYIDLYQSWASYEAESEGVFIAYTSVYGHTKAAVELLAEKLTQKGCPNVITCDLAREDMAKAVENAFRYNKLVLATTTYNAGIFPFMEHFIHGLTERNFQKRTVAFMENGSWAPLAAKVMKEMLSKSKDLIFTDTTVSLLSALSDESREQIEKLSDELCFDYLAQQEETANKSDLAALFKIGYGLYVVTSHDGNRDNGCIVNSVTQLTDNPNRIAVGINKKNYSHDVIKKTGIMNVNCLSVDAPFSVFENFGFQTGAQVDKFAKMPPLRSDNGLAFLHRYINAFFSLKVEQYIDLGSHGIFICSVTESRVLSDLDTMTYTYYQKNVKPRPETDGKKGWVCKICGYVHESEDLPDDFICPLCKHGVADFERIE